MKFGKQLALRSIPAWTIYYMDYTLLKKAIKDFELRRIDSDNDPKELEIIQEEFKVIFSSELDKVDVKYIEEENRSSSKLEQLKSQWTEQITPEDPSIWRNEFTSLMNSLEDLYEFTQTNISGFQKILKKFDKHLNTNTKELWWPMVSNRQFVKSIKDETLLFEAKQIWRKRVPLAQLDPTEDIHPIESEIPTIQSLDLDALPGGQISRLWVVVAENGLSLPIKVPGVKPGPIVGITAALHGNELNGIPLIHRLFREIKPSALHGTIVAVPVVNVAGYLSSQRLYDGVDLNRLMPGKKNGSTPQVYSYNIMNQIINKFEYLLDLHTASRGRVNSLNVRANMTDPRTRNMSHLQNPQIIIHNKSPDGSLRGAAMELGIPAITVEIGDSSKFQKKFVQSALMGVTNILSHLKMIADESATTISDHDPVICSESYWIYATRGGTLNVLPDVNTWVKQNEPIATIHNIFGKLEETYYAPEDGIVVGKNVDPVCQSGNRILHLGVISGEFSMESSQGHV